MRLLILTLTLLLGGCYQYDNSMPNYVKAGDPVQVQKERNECELEYYKATAYNTGPYSAYYGGRLQGACLRAKGFTKVAW